MVWNGGFAPQYFFIDDLYLKLSALITNFGFILPRAFQNLFGTSGIPPNVMVGSGSLHHPLAIQSFFGCISHSLVASAQYFFVQRRQAILWLRQPCQAPLPLLWLLLLPGAALPFNQMRGRDAQSIWNVSCVLTEFLTCLDSMLRLQSS